MRILVRIYFSFRESSSQAMRDYMHEIWSLRISHDNFIMQKSVVLEKNRLTIGEQKNVFLNFYNLRRPNCIDSINRFYRILQKSNWSYTHMSMGTHQLSTIFASTQLEQMIASSISPCAVHYISYFLFCLSPKFLSSLLFCRGRMFL